MKDTTDKLQKLLARIAVLHNRTDDAQGVLAKARVRWHDRVQNQIEIARRRAETGGPKEQTAYQNLIRARRLLT